MIKSAPWLAPGEVAGHWVAAGELEVGDRLRKADGATGTVSNVKVVVDAEVMYNLAVDVAHTYFVGDQLWLVHNACGGKQGGRYKDLDAQGKYVRHHMPAGSVSPLSHDNAPAILMEPVDHVRTASWGRSKAAQAYRAAQKKLIDAGLFDDAIQMDIDDILQKFGDKYNQAILEMIDSLK